MTAGRYELEPLRRLSGMSKSDLQKHLGVSGREWRRYWDEGVSWKVADRCAGRCGFHPGEVWPEWMADSIEETGTRCAQCSAVFLPTRTGHKFCSTSCSRRSRDAEWQRQRLLRDMEYRTKKNAYAAAYRGAYGPSLNAAKREHYQANRESYLARQAIYDRTVRKARRAAQRSTQGWSSSPPQVTEETMTA